MKTRKIVSNVLPLISSGSYLREKLSKDGLRLQQSHQYLQIL